MTDSRLTRRGFMAVVGAGAASASMAAAWTAPRASAAAGGASHGDASGRAGSRRRGRQLADAVIEAFRRHRIVAIGEMHGQQEHHDALQTLLADPRLPEVVDDIVVEFGNALYQPVMDRFVAGPAASNPELRLVWRNTTQSPLQTWDMPVYEQFFRMVRAANWTLPPGQQVRVLLGDPPIDWSKITTRDQVLAFGLQRDAHMAALVEQEVLAKGRRAMICYGSEHVVHSYRGRGSGGVALIEEQTGQRPYVIVAGSHPRLSSYPRRTVIPCKGTWLGSTDADQFSNMPFCGDNVPLVLLADAVLYLGQPADLTQSVWNPAIYLDPLYWAELQRRNAIMGNNVDLEQYRQEQPVSWPSTGGCQS